MRGCVARQGRYLLESDERSSLLWPELDVETDSMRSTTDGRTGNGPTRMAIMLPETGADELLRILLDDSQLPPALRLGQQEASILE